MSACHPGDRSRGDHEGLPRGGRQRPRQHRPAAGRDPRGRRRERRRQDDADGDPVRAAAPDSGRIVVDGAAGRARQPARRARGRHRLRPAALLAHPDAHRRGEPRARAARRRRAGRFDDGRRPRPRARRRATGSRSTPTRASRTSASATSSAPSCSRRSRATRACSILDEPNALLTPQEWRGARPRAAPPGGARRRDLPDQPQARRRAARSPTASASCVAGAWSTRSGRAEATPRVARRADDRRAARWTRRSPSTPAGDGRAGEPTVLEVADLRVRGDRGEDAVKGVTLSVRAGEVLGIAGVEGSGQIELTEALVRATRRRARHRSARRRGHHGKRQSASASASASPTSRRTAATPASSDR